MPRRLVKYPNNFYDEDIREVPEARIKCCSGIINVPRYYFEWNTEEDERRISREACESMGRMIAEKLMEFNKVRKEVINDIVLYHYWVEVIVPKDAPI